MWRLLASSSLVCSKNIRYSAFKAAVCDMDEVTLTFLILPPKSEIVFTLQVLKNAIDTQVNQSVKRIVHPTWLFNMCENIKFAMKYWTANYHFMPN